MKCFSLILFILLPIFPGFCQAENSYAVSNTEILNSAIEMSGACTIAVYANDDKGVIVLLNDMGEGRLNRFFKANEQWDMFAETPLFTPASIIEEQEHWRLCIIGREETPDKKIRTVVSIYNADDAILNLEKPEVAITIPASKRFASERRRSGQQLLVLPDKAGHYLLVGTCTEAKWDPISIVGNIISGGHGGFSRRPFLVEIEDQNTLSYYKWPEDLWTNEVVSTTAMSLYDDKYHLVGIKSKEYMPHFRSIVYSYFDVELKKWNKPVTLYKEKRNGEYRDTTVGRPEVLAVEGKVFVAWSLRNDAKLGTGVFVRYMTNDNWNDIEKISSSGDRPLIIEHNKVIYIFWGEKGKGLSYSSYTNGIWSKAQLAVKDENVFTYHRFPWAITTDDSGSFHIVYPQKCPSKGYRLLKNLIYVKLEKD